MSGFVGHIFVSDVYRLPKVLHVGHAVTFTPFEHLLERNPIEPVSARSGIVAREKIGTTMVHGMTLGVVGVVLPKESGLAHSFSRKGIDGVKLETTSHYFVLDFPNGEGAIGGLVGVSDGLFHDVLLFLR